MTKHYLTKNYVYKSFVLGVIRIPEKKDEAALTALVREMFGRYGIITVGKKDPADEGKDCDFNSDDVFSATTDAGGAHEQSYGKKVHQQASSMERKRTEHAETLPITVLQTQLLTTLSYV